VSLPSHICVKSIMEIGSMNQEARQGGNFDCKSSEEPLYVVRITLSSLLLKNVPSPRLKTGRFVRMPATPRRRSKPSGLNEGPFLFGE